MEALRWVPEWDREPQKHPNISTVEKKAKIGKTGPDHIVYSPESLSIVLLHPDWAAQRDLLGVRKL